jgi:hypothetical protein
MAINPDGSYWFIVDDHGGLWSERLNQFTTNPADVTSYDDASKQRSLLPHGGTWRRFTL